jgi:hypothetical protein
LYSQRNIGTISDSTFTASPAIYNATFTNGGGIITPAQNPLFVGEGNYHIQSGSPVKDQANATYAPDDDIDGDSRPQGSADDMGADEYKSGNVAPVLSWTGESNYTTDGVNPDSGSGGASFEFRVSYTDTENVAPTSIQVWVDEDDDGTYENGEKYDMTQTDISDSIYTDGKFYTKSLTLSYAGNGILNYRFYASDGPNNATGTPTADSTVTVINSLPVGGYIVDNVIPTAQITQSSNGDGIITINWKGRDNDSNNVILKNFESPLMEFIGARQRRHRFHSVTGMITAAAVTPATTFASASSTFIFDTDHADVTGMSVVISRMCGSGLPERLQ